MHSWHCSGGEGFEEEGRGAGDTRLFIDKTMIRGIEIERFLTQLYSLLCAFWGIVECAG